MACILGGAIGNVIDRVVHGYVVDFLDFHWNWLAPLFNGGHLQRGRQRHHLGAICLVFDELIRVRKKARTGSHRQHLLTHPDGLVGGTLVHRYAIQHAVRDFSA